jgi:hypothetical protein
MRAQKDAMALWGLDEDHMSILTSEDAISFLNQAIAAGFSEESQ